MFACCALAAPTFGAGVLERCHTTIDMLSSTACGSKPKRGTAEPPRQFPRARFALAYVNLLTILPSLPGLNSLPCSLEALYGYP
jgi:hypothetical protein